MPKLCPHCGKPTTRPRAPNNSITPKLRDALAKQSPRRWTSQQLAKAANVPNNKTLYNAIAYLVRNEELTRVSWGMYYSTRRPK